MAAIQKIRSKGKLLIAIIGIALLAFITEEFFRAQQGLGNQKANVMGIVDGEKISVQEYNDMIESIKNYVGFTQGKSTFTEDEDAMLKEQAWEGYVQNKLIEAEAGKLGLTVTDDELRNVLSEGTHPMLQQSPFADPQTGRFSAAALKQFIDEYNKLQNGTSQIPEQYKEQYVKIYGYWQFVEKTLKEGLLQSKYLSLANMSVTSNAVEAKLAFDASTTADLLVAGIPYSSINDKDVPVTDAEMQAKYDEIKERYKVDYLSKDIKYVAVNVKASDKDVAALDEKLAGFAAELATAADPSAVVRRSQSTVTYRALPCTAEAFPQDIAAMLDSVAVGSVKAPYYNAADNTKNIIKLISKIQAPDSILVRQIQVGGKDVADARKRADSIYTALQAGADFKAIAKKYQQTGDSAWLVSNMYQTATMDKENLDFMTKVQDMAVGTMDNVEFAQGNIIVRVEDRKAMVTKYDAAVIKCPVNFSQETSKSEYNKFSKFVAENKSIDAMEKNAAKSGYTVQTLNFVEPGDFFAASKFYSQPGGDRHMMRWISRDAQKWIFDEAEDGDVSTLYTCDNGAHLLVVGVVKTHKPGYLTLDDEAVKNDVKNEVLRDKKAEKIMAQLKAPKTLAQVMAVKGAVQDSVKNVSFFSDGQCDPVILGTVTGKKVNEFVGPLKGYDAIYAYQVINVNKSADAKFDENQMRDGVANLHAGMAMSARQYGIDSPLMTYLKSKAKIVDARYSH